MVRLKHGGVEPGESTVIPAGRVSAGNICFGILKDSREEEKFAGYFFSMACCIMR